MLFRTPRFLLFFFNDTATTEIYTLSLHDALPISHGVKERRDDEGSAGMGGADLVLDDLAYECGAQLGRERERRSEEHTSELQSRLHLVCRLLLEKKKIVAVGKMSPLTMRDPLGGA